MSIQFIDRRCTVDVHPASRGYSFEYGGKTHQRRSEEGVHRFFLKKYRSEKLDTVKLHINEKKYYLHFTLDEPEKFTSKRALRSVLAKENGGAWVEEKNGKQRYFMQEGWLFSRVREVSEEEFFAPRTSSLMQIITTLALGALSMGSVLVHTARRLPAASHAPSMVSRLSPCVSLVGFSLLHASPVLAQMPAFGEFMINTNMTKFPYATSQDGYYSRSHPKLTGLTGGGFAAAWMSYAQDGSGMGTYGQGYDAAGFPVGSEFRINTYTMNDQANPTLAGLTDGGFVVAWESLQNGVDYDVYCQRYNVSGAPAGSEFRINTNTTGNQQNPTLADLKDGGFIAAWVGTQTGYPDIYGQRYNAIGLPQESEFLINTITTNVQDGPILAGLMDGGFVVVWEGYQTGNYDIYAQRYNVSGVPAGSEFRINTITTGDQQNPSLAGLADGGFVAAWQGDQTGNTDIYGQMYDASGAPVGSEFRINTNTTSIQQYPTLTGLTDRGFVAAWDGTQTGDYEVYGQRYNASGAPVRSEFRINTNITNFQTNPTLAGLTDGGFVAAWCGAQTGYGDIYGQRYDANGVPVISPPSYAPPPLPSPLAGSPATGSPTPASSSSARDPLPAPSPLSTVYSKASAGSSQSSLSSSSPSQSSPTLGIISITDVSYGISYAIYVNGVSVGTFEITGGTGLVSGNLSNTLTIHLDASTDLGQGPISLFTFSTSQGNFQSLVIMGDGSTSCRVPEGTIVQDSSGQSTYQAIYTTKTCTTADAARPASAFFPMTMLKV